MNPKHREHKIAQCNQVLSVFHHLYRPHHNHNHVTHMYHLGVEAEVTYSEEYEVVARYKREDRIVETKLKLPCPVFKKNMFLRARIVKFNKVKFEYQLSFLFASF